MTTKASIAKEISSKTLISSKDSKKIIDSFISTIIRNVESKTIKINRFGTFKYQNTPKRLGRNPKTKESYIINPMKKVIFKASNYSKKVLN